MKRSMILDQTASSGGTWFVRLLQAACYAAGPAVFVLGVNASARMGTTPGEILIGVLASASLALGLVSLGTLTALYVEIRRR